MLVVLRKKRMAIIARQRFRFMESREAIPLLAATAAAAAFTAALFSS